MTDPTHPLFGRTFKLIGLARLPGHVRHCHVEILPGQCGFVPVESTQLHTGPRAEPAILTEQAIQELMAVFQALPSVRRGSHGRVPKSGRVGSPAGKGTGGSGRGNHSNSHGGGRT